ncbi:ankyrin repeat domain-containing protein [Rickettsia endosymbiont of Cantharis rufa]|uniref:ankyrin repeat domain-containing protein n=1 Tax=Rickettsia endosymbiont of Cantharis rufa TaxID=3066248 RepID=UPI00313336A7
MLELDITAVDKKGENNTLYLVILDSLGGNIELITFLIANGININHLNSLGNTALLYSVASDYSSVIRILLENGADINIKNNENITPAILLQNEMRINQI